MEPFVLRTSSPGLDQKKVMEMLDELNSIVFAAKEGGMTEYEALIRFDAAADREIGTKRKGFKAEDVAEYVITLRESISGGNFK